MTRWWKRAAVALGVAGMAMLGAATWLLRAADVPKPALAGSLSQDRLVWESRTRTYSVYRPAAPEDAPAIVFVLHGSMGDGASARMRSAFEFDRLADEKGFLVVYPDGFERHWNGCRAAGPYTANTLDVDDVGFLRQIAERLVHSDGADARRIFATGFSNGGHLSLRLGLEAPDFVRAIAPIAASLPSGDNLGCRPTGRPMSIFLINGTDDPMNPFSGGRVALYGLWGDRGTVHSSDETIRSFAREAGYHSDPIERPLPDVRKDDGSAIVEMRWHAPGRPEVVLWAIQGGGHTMPHPRRRDLRLLGATNADVNAPEAIWSFFERAGPSRPVER